MKDWVGNKNANKGTLGVMPNMTTEDREENDYYATNHEALRLLLEHEDFSDVWEVSCGAGHLAKELCMEGLLSKATDLIDRGYGKSGIDFLEYDGVWEGDIVTNPPYKFAQQFVEKSIAIGAKKIAMFLKIQFLEGVARQELFKKCPPRYVYVMHRRGSKDGLDWCGENGEFKTKTNAVCFAWFVWYDHYKGETIVRWL